MLSNLRSKINEKLRHKIYVYEIERFWIGVLWRWQFGQQKWRIWINKLKGTWRKYWPGRAWKLIVSEYIPHLKHIHVTEGLKQDSSTLSHRKILESFLELYEDQEELWRGRTASRPIPRVSVTPCDTSTMVWFRSRHRSWLKEPAVRVRKLH